MTIGPQPRNSGEPRGALMLAQPCFPGLFPLHCVDVPGGQQLGPCGTPDSVSLCPAMPLARRGLSSGRTCLGLPLVGAMALCLGACISGFSPREGQDPKEEGVCLGLKCPGHPTIEGLGPKGLREGCSDP